jgi:hypothetical protein
MSNRLVGIVVFCACHTNSIAPKRDEMVSWTLNDPESCTRPMLLHASDTAVEREPVKIGKALRVHLNDGADPSVLESILQGSGATSHLDRTEQGTLTVVSDDPKVLCNAARLIGATPGINALQIEVVGQHGAPGLLMQAVTIESSGAGLAALRASMPRPIEGIGGSVEQDIWRFVVTIDGTDPFNALNECERWPKEAGFTACRPRIVPMISLH